MVSGNARDAGPVGSTREAATFCASLDAALLSS
jgi:hypothetical protein